MSGERKRGFPPAPLLWGHSPKECGKRSCKGGVLQSPPFPQGLKSDGWQPTAKGDYQNYGKRKEGNERNYGTSG